MQHFSSMGNLSASSKFKDSSIRCYFDQSFQKIPKLGKIESFQRLDQEHFTDPTLVRIHLGLLECCT